MGKKNEEYDWLDDPFNDRKEHKDQKPQGGCSGFVLIAVLLVIVLLVALGFFALNGLSALTDVATS